MDPQRLQALFLAEGRDLLSALDDDLLLLERSPTARASLDAAFRAMHSLKGMSATVGLDALASMLHDAESLLAAARESGALPASAARLLLQATRACAEAMDTTERGEPAPPALAAAHAAVRTALPTATAAGPAPSAATTAQRLASAIGAPGAQWMVQVTIARDAPLPAARAAVVQRRVAAQAPVLRMVPDAEAQLLESWDRQLTLWVAAGAAAPALEAAVRGAGGIAECVVRAAEEPPAAAPRAPLAEQVARSVRIPLARLDDLLDLMGELVVLRDRLQRQVSEHQAPALRDTVEQAARVITSLRDAVLVSRMVPLATIVDRFPRLVRDLAGTLDKDVALHLEGRELEVDRSLLDELTEPLTHLIRNAIGHGLESRAAREAAGKPVSGRVVVRAERDGAMVAVTVADDGRGVDRARVIEKAEALGLANAAERAATDAGLLTLLAHPGLSTASAVDAVSGRGVGVDAVLARVQALGGRLTLATEPGRGTAWTIHLPLSVAILRAVLVRVADEQYAIPMAGVRETRLLAERLGPEAASVAVDGEELPLVHLRRRVGLPPADDESGQLVVVERATTRVALLVDRCLSHQEIVVKPLQRVRGAATLFSGGTILADGTPSLILDINTLA